MRQSNQFDIILFDSPPLLGLSDAPLLSRFSDGVLLTVSLNNVERNLPLEAKDSILRNGGNVLGLIVNTVKENQISGLTYGGYGYGYGYGY